MTVARKTTHIVAAAVAVLALLQGGAASAAAASCRPEVTPWLDQGMALYDTEKYGEALPLFTKSLALCRARGDLTGVSAALYEYGHTLFMLNRFADSEQALLEGWALRQSLDDGDPYKEMQYYPNEFMYLYRQWGRFALAWEWGDKAIKAKARYVGAGSSSYATTLSNVSGIGLQTKEYERALPYAVEAMEIWGRLSGIDSTDHAWGMRDVGVLLLRMGRLQQAFGYLDRAYRIRLQAFGANRTETQTSTGDLAAWYTAAGNDRMALEFAEKALANAQARSGVDSLETSFALARVAGIALRLGLAGQARGAADASLAIRRKQLGDAHPHTVSAWQDAALAALADNLLGAAETAAASGLRHCQAAYAAIPATCAAHQLTHGKVLLALGQAQGALDAAAAATAVQALRAAPAPGGAQGPADVSDGGSRAGSTALSAALPPELSPDAAAALLLAAQATGALGNAGAMAAALQALEARLQAKPDSPADGRADGRADMLADIRDQVRQAALLARAALPELSAEALASLAAQAVQRAALLAAARGQSHPAHGQALLDAAGLAQRSGDGASAKRHAAGALAIAIANGDALDEARAAALLGALGDNDAAVYLGKQAVNALQATRAGAGSLPAALQASFIRQKRDAYDRLADRLLDRRRIAEAETVLAMVREDQFHSLVRGEADGRTTRLAFTGPEDALRRGMERQACALLQGAAALAAARTRQAQGAPDGEAAFAAARGAMAALLAGAADHFASLPALPAFPALPAIPALPVQRAADDAAPAPAPSAGMPARGELRLTYLVTASHLRIVAQLGSTATVHTVPIDERQLARRIAALRRSAQHPGQDPRAEARALYRLLVEPVAPALARARSLAIVSSGVLRYLPFGMLYDGRSWLVERLPVRLSHAGGAAAGTGQDPGRIRSLALFGQTRAVGELPALPFVGTELRQVAAAVRRSHTASKAWVDEAFTAGALELALPAHRIVHIASHFVLRSGLNQDSYLLTGDGQALSLAELGAQRFRFDGLDLLTLSACETAVPAGTDDSGREVAGLAWLARQRGARNVLASLWRVSDQSTAALMADFYAALARGAGKAEALRIAQLRQIRSGASGSFGSFGSLGSQGRQGRAPQRGLTPLALPGQTAGAPGRAQGGRSHPFYWAGFTLLGA